jgi:hypothetical protein
MPERDTKVLEMLLSQVRENALIDVVLGKSLGVFGHAERCQPLCALGHGFPFGGLRYRRSNAKTLSGLVTFTLTT